MLVDVVLVVDGQYWRRWQDLSVVPGPGTVVQVLAGVEAQVGGCADLSARGEDGLVTVAVLLCAGTAGQRGGLGPELRRAGWHWLL